MVMMTVNGGSGYVNKSASLIASRLFSLNDYGLNRNEVLELWGVSLRILVLQAQQARFFMEQNVPHARSFRLNPKSSLSCWCSLYFSFHNSKLRVSFV